ncbi:permease prefix domain 1-containing protein [Dactylosporangium sp. CS-047395]|uniref:permease prefix domain 1-containing protein n=1 Tax=Dactylosporangium sp. CS-047395 TaxID=3239936 RepID=UPI003D943021
MSEIDWYLDDLFNRLSGQGAAGRRMLEEAADHLRSAADAHIAAGLPPEQAEREAVLNFGGAGEVATQLLHVHEPTRLAAAASTATAVAGRTLLMLAGCHVVAGLSLGIWGGSASIARQTTWIGAALLLGALVLLAARRPAPPFGWLGAAVITLGGVAALVDVPLALALTSGETNLHRHAAALLTGFALANLAGVGLTMYARHTHATRRSAPAPTNATVA